MKTVEEMTNNVFRRMQEYHVEKQRKAAMIKRITVPVTCGFCAVLMGFGVWLSGYTKSPVTLPADSTVSTGNQEPSTPFIVLYAQTAKAEATETVLQSNENYSYDILLDFVSTKGLTVEQKNAIFEDCVAKAKKYTYRYIGKSGGHTVYTTQDEYVVAVAFTDLFRVKIDDKKEFKQMRVYNTAMYGQIEVHGSISPEDGRPQVMPKGKNVVVTKEMAEKMGGYPYQKLHTLAFTWEPTNDSTKLLEDSKQMDYTAFNDTIYIELEYADGTKTTGSVRLIFDESGQATVLCGEYSLFAQ